MSAPNLPPFLYPSVAWFIQGMRHGFVVGMGGNFEKQTERSRYSIAGPNKLQTLPVPLKHGTAKSMHDMQVSHDHSWAKEHLKAIETAYGNAPFYEFYDYRVLPLLSHGETSLTNVIQQSIMLLHKELQCPGPIIFSDEPCYALEPVAVPAYPQVFDDRFGFRPEVSALDLLFNQGPMACDYLKKAAGL